MKKCILFCLIFCFTTHLAYSLPAQVLIIRHAEKPPIGDILSTKGRERAAALAFYLSETKELLQFGLPVALYAMGPSQDDQSKRPIETITPLSERIKLPIIALYTRDDYKQMVAEIKNNPVYEGKSVIISWEHQRIPEIARAFGALQSPGRWNDDVFDRVWMITWSKTGRANFQNIPQRLLFGDSTN